jgi:hypothetical protein
MLSHNICSCVWHTQRKFLNCVTHTMINLFGRLEIGDRVCPVLNKYWCHVEHRSPLTSSPSWCACFTSPSSSTISAKCGTRREWGKVFVNQDVGGIFCKNHMPQCTFSTSSDSDKKNIAGELDRWWRGTLMQLDDEDNTKEESNLSPPPIASVRQRMWRITRSKKTQCSPPQGSGGAAWRETRKWWLYPLSRGKRIVAIRKLSKWLPKTCCY